MDMKKWLNRYLVAGSCLLAMNFVACSDSSSGADDDDDAASSSSKLDGDSGIADIGTGDEEDGVTYVTISEIMYNAPEGSELEWVELAISSGDKIFNMNASNLHLDGAISYTFPKDAGALDVGEYIVVANDLNLFKKTYPNFKGRLFGPWDGGKTVKLSNEGDVIDVKMTGKGDVSVAFSNEPPWPSLADGKGHTLVLKGGNATQASSWGASKEILGNPGEGPDSYIVASNVRLNEIKPYTSESDQGWIELYNKGKSDVDVKGWKFKSKLKGKSWTIGGSDTKVPAGGYLVLKPTAEVFGEEFALSYLGGEYYLYEVVGGKETGSESSLLLAASKKSSGVVDVSDGSIAQGALAKETPGAANSALAVGSVFINELHYHPVDATTGKVDFPDEFLEIVNKSSSDISLYESIAGYGGKGWKIEGVNMEFGVGDVLKANGMMVLFPDSLETAVSADGLRKKYSIDSKVDIKFYKGKLSNRGEMVAVKKPVHCEKATGEDGMVSSHCYYDWSDATLYSDKWKGFAQTDGYGQSMQRAKFETMGYEASAWKAAAPTPGK